LLLHVVDASAADVDIQITAVTDILRDLHLDGIPRLLVFNKCDRLPAAHIEPLCRRYGAIGISALHPATLSPLLTQLEAHVRALTPARPGTELTSSAMMALASHR
jgi:GTP-binding protein HflX